MDKRATFGFLQLCAAFLLSCCSQDHVTSLSSQVENQEVDFSFFEKTISDIDTRGGVPPANGVATRGDTDSGKSLKDSQSVSELAVAIFPQNKEFDSVYVVRQDTNTVNFGQFKAYLPVGSYKMVAIAANTTTLKEGKRVEIEGVDKVVFPNGKVTDMFYATKDLTIEPGGGSQSVSCSMQRGVTKLELYSNQIGSGTAKKFSWTITGNCGNVFNPTTGYCVASSSPLTWTYDVSNITKYKIHIGVFLIPGADDISDVTVTTKAVDANDKTIKELTFTNVHLVKGKKTNYTGPFFHEGVASSFTIDNGKLDSSGYDKTFE